LTNSFNAEQGTAGVPAVPFRADELLLRELQDWLQRSYRLALSFSSLSRLLTPPNWPLKKSLDAAERDTVAHQEKRVTWRTQVDALDPVRLVFADERGLMRSVTRRYGRAPTGQPVPGAVPLGHWR